jgi:uncharacterized membrane protein HdeD (DUF308 family)
MKQLLASSWQTLLFRGIFAIIFALVAFMWPHITLLSLIYLFAFYAIADGISTIAGAVQNRKRGRNWGLLMLMGIVSLLVGFVTLIFPGLTAIYLILFIGFRAVFDGILTIVAAIRLRKEIENEGLMIFEGIISILFGAWVILRPGRGALALVWLIALFALVAGILLISLAFKAKGWTKGKELAT